MFEALRIKPTRGRVVVERREVTKDRESLIFIPETVKDQKYEGKVLAVGEPDVDKFGNKIYIDVKKDDNILFGKYSGTEMTIMGRTLIIMKHTDIIGILED